MITGIDLSSNNGAVDLAAVKASGQAFVIIKATEGTSYVNPYFAQQWTQAAQLGLVRAAYHFATDTDPQAEATHFAQTVAAAGFGPGDGLFDDLEAGGRSWPADCAPWGASFADMVAQMLGRKPGLYSGSSFWAAHNLDGVGAPIRWLASYGSQPAVPWDIWQYTATGNVPGVAGACDINQYRGTVDQLRVLFGGQPQENNDVTTELTLGKDGGGNTHSVYFDPADGVPWTEWGGGVGTPSPQRQQIAANHSPNSRIKEITGGGVEVSGELWVTALGRDDGRPYTSRWTPGEAVDAYWVPA